MIVWFKDVLQVGHPASNDFKFTDCHVCLDSLAPACLLEFPIEWTGGGATRLNKKAWPRGPQPLLMSPVRLGLGCRRHGTVFSTKGSGRALSSAQRGRGRCLFLLTVQSHTDRLSRLPACKGMWNFERQPAVIHWIPSGPSCGLLQTYEILGPIQLRSMGSSSVIVTERDRLVQSNRKRPGGCSRSAVNSDQVYTCLRSEILLDRRLHPSQPVHVGN